ncbi:MAG: hypothetical protein ACXWQQ_03690 [Pseudobdellovibrio sp.]
MNFNFAKLVKKWIQSPHVSIPLLVLIVAASAFGIRAVNSGSQNAHQEVQAFQFSSLAQAQKDLEKTEYQALQKLSDNELIGRLERSKHLWSRQPQSLGMTVNSMEQIEQKSKKRLPKRFENNPVFKLLEKLSDSVISTDYEEIIACDRDRQFYENKLDLNPDLQKLIQKRIPAAGEFAPECVTYSMRQYQVPKTNFAVCPVSSGIPSLPGAKPCVTSRLVNLTYNAFTDVAGCLNLNAKQLMPQIDFESGFFLNAYGVDRESGVGQLTAPLIDEVNSHFDKYMTEIEKAAGSKKSCASLLESKKYLTKISSKPEQRCGAIGIPENPLRNIFYGLLYSKINSDKITGIKYSAGADVESDPLAGLFNTAGIKEKLGQLGYNEPNLNFLSQAVALLSYQTGPETAVKLLQQYLDLRIENKLPVSWKDFDFYNAVKEVDLDGKEKDSIEIARSYVTSSIIDPKDTPEIKKLKVAKRKNFPKVWQAAYAESFPVFLTLRANSYNGNSTDVFTIYGYPGYISVIADRNQTTFQLFQNSDVSPASCLDPEFLKVPHPVSKE